MRITIINIANKMPQWVQEACNEYLKRINHGKYACKLIELKADKNQHKTSLENMAIEAKKIQDAIPHGSYIIALDERGKAYNSIELAKFMQNTALSNSSICLIIGGSDGIHPDLRAKAHAQISLSNLVFPHALVRIIILEQIYRVISILENHPYHRE
jgi:23S rRNA (pseudouridine1915-N3)-methyltransferase